MKDTKYWTVHFRLIAPDGASNWTKAKCELPAEATIGGVKYFLAGAINHHAELVELCQLIDNGAGGHDLCRVQEIARTVLENEKKYRD